MRFAAVFLIFALFSTAYGCQQILKCYDNELNRRVNGLINVELTEHYTYLYLSQIFDKDTNHYPAVAKYMRAKADEELSHAERFIQYQNQRGGTVKMDPVMLYQEGACRNVQTVPLAFQCAMELEAHVTRELTQVHQDVSNVGADYQNECLDVEDIPEDDLRLTQPMLVTCPLTEGGEDVTTSKWYICHCDSIKSVAYVELAEMIAHEFLEHQVEETKEVANHYTTLKKLQSRRTSGLGDYLFDIQLGS